MEQKISVFCDGGARGNPGPAGVGVVITDDGKERRFKKFIGDKTNNQAEYEAVLYALEIINQFYPHAKAIDFFLDSELVVKQMRGEYKIKNEDLGRLLIMVRNGIISNNIEANFSHVPRLKNHHADALVNQAIDESAKRK